MLPNSESSPTPMTTPYTEENTHTSVTITTAFYTYCKQLHLDYWNKQQSTNIMNPIADKQNWTTIIIINANSLSSLRGWAYKLLAASSVTHLWPQSWRCVIVMTRCLLRIQFPPSLEMFSLEKYPSLNKSFGTLYKPAACMLLTTFTTVVPTLKYAKLLTFHLSVSTTDEGSHEGHILDLWDIAVGGGHRLRLGVFTRGCGLSSEARLIYFQVNSLDQSDVSWHSVTEGYIDCVSRHEVAS